MLTTVSSHTLSFYILLLLVMFTKCKSKLRCAYTNKLYTFESFSHRITLSIWIFELLSFAHTNGVRPWPRNERHSRSTRNYENIQNCLPRYVWSFRFRFFTWNFTKSLQQAIATIRQQLGDTCRWASRVTVSSWWRWCCGGGRCCWRRRRRCRRWISLRGRRHCILQVCWYNL